MNKIISIALLAGTFFVGASSVYASHMSGQYYVIPTYSSYTYTDGCNTYRYDPYTRTSTFLYTTCQTSYYPNYNYGYNYGYNYQYYNNYSNNYQYYPCVNNGSYSYNYPYYYPYNNYSSCYNYSTYVPTMMNNWYYPYQNYYSDSTCSPYYGCSW